MPAAPSKSARPFLSAAVSGPAPFHRPAPNRLAIGRLAAFAAADWLSSLVNPPRFRVLELARASPGKARRVPLPLAVFCVRLVRAAANKRQGVGSRPPASASTLVLSPHPSNCYFPLSSAGAPCASVSLVCNGSSHTPKVSPFLVPVSPFVPRFFETASDVVAQVGRDLLCSPRWLRIHRDLFKPTYPP